MAPRVIDVYDEELDRMVKKVLLPEVVEPQPTFCAPKRKLNRGTDFRGDPRLFDANNMPELVLEVLQCIYDEIKAQDEDLAAV